MEKQQPTHTCFFRGVRVRTFADDEKSQSLDEFEMKRR